MKMFLVGVIHCAGENVKTATALPAPSRRNHPITRSEDMQRALLAAAGCKQLAEIKLISKKHNIVILGTMTGEQIQPLASRVGKEPVEIYLYETG